MRTPDYMLGLVSYGGTMVPRGYVIQELRSAAIAQGHHKQQAARMADRWLQGYELALADRRKRHDTKLSKTTKALTAEQLAEKTKDAYSVNRYRSWTACIKMLQGRGYSDAEVEGIMAADASDKRYGHTTAADLAKFLDDPRNGCTKAEIRSMAV